MTSRLICTVFIASLCAAGALGAQDRLAFAPPSVDIVVSRNVRYRTPDTVALSMAARAPVRSMDSVNTIEP